MIVNVSKSKENQHTSMSKSKSTIPTPFNATKESSYLSAASCTPVGIPLYDFVEAVVYYFPGRVLSAHGSVSS